MKQRLDEPQVREMSDDSLPAPPFPGRAEDGALQPWPSWALVITLISEQLGAPLSNPSQHRAGHGAG